MPAWIEKYKELWEKRFDALEMVVQELKKKKEKMKNQTNAERKSDRELVSSRIINGPSGLNNCSSSNSLLELLAFSSNEYR